MIRAFFEASGKGDQAAVERTLSPGFQSVHTNGVSDRQGELDLIRNMKLGSPSAVLTPKVWSGPPNDALTMPGKTSRHGSIVYAPHL